MLYTYAVGTTSHIYTRRSLLLFVSIFDSYKKGDMEIVGVKEDGTLVLNGDETTETTTLFSRASAMKEKGNLLLVKMKRTFEAIRVYTTGIELITESGKKNRPDDPKLRRLLLELYSNWYVFLAYSTSYRTHVQHTHTAPWHFSKKRISRVRSYSVIRPLSCVLHNHTRQCIVRAKR